MRVALLAAALLAGLHAPAHAQLGGGGGGLGSGGGGSGQSSQNGGGENSSGGGVDWTAVGNGDFSSVQSAVADWKSRNEAGECGGDGLMNSLRAGAAGALATQFSGGGYPTMDIGAIIRLMAQLKESQDQSDIQCGIRRDQSTLTDMVDRAESGWRSVIPDGVTVDSLLAGHGANSVLSSWFNNFFRRDRVFEAPDVSFDMREQNRRGRAISGGMAAQQALLDQISQREAAMAALVSAHRDARTASQKQDIANRYREEQAKVSMLRGQMEAVGARTAMEERNFDQRIREERAREIDLWHARLLAARAARFVLE